MKLCHACLSVLFLCFCTAYAYADTIPGDGTIRVGRGSDPSASKSCSKTDFKITLNGHGGGITNCINTSGEDWTGLDIFAVIPSDQTVTCLSLLFTNCTFQTVKSFGKSNKKEVEIELFGGNLITTGSATDDCMATLAPRSCFFINLNNLDSSVSGGWFGLSGALNGTIDVHAITPEPGTLLLLVSGAGALCFRRRRSSLA